jgi:hypothetical protein
MLYIESEVILMTEQKKLGRRRTVEDAEATTIYMRKKIKRKVRMEGAEKNKSMSSIIDGILEQNYDE